MRYIDSLNLNENIKIFILIEPGLGYIIPVLQERFKTSKILVLHIENFSAENTYSAASSIYSTDAKEIQIFLETHIQEENIANIKVIEWRPSLNYYKDVYVKLLSQVAGFLKRTDAVNRTTAVFGRRWFRNFFRNLENLKKIILYKKANLPVIITGSGPGLEQEMDFIHKVQSHCLIIASSSSVMALLHNNIKPDIVIATDGSPWALWHIYPYLRDKTEKMFAVNMCAALPSQCTDVSRLIINDGSLWQSVILHELSIPSVIIPQRGTVTATALELAMILSDSEIYLAGMDLSVQDRTHVKPYSFDSLFYSQASRILPVTSVLYKRSILIRHGGSMDIYAAWFKNQLSGWSNKIFYIGQKHRIFDNIDKIQAEKKITEYNIKNSSLLLKTVDIKNESSLCQKGIRALLGSLKNPEYSGLIKQELKSMFNFTDKDFTDNEPETEIYRLIHG